MGVLLKWKKPSAESSYDTVRIYRSTTETGTYSLIASQTIADNSYYDMEGDANQWYKLDFYDSISGNVTNLSDAVQGNEIIGYCDVDFVRIMTNIKTNQVTDTQLAILIEMAASQVNTDISVKHDDERVEWISGVKPNTVDASNTQYYAKNYPIGDKNDSFNISTTDIVAYTINSLNVKTEVTVTSVTQSDGGFVLLNPVANDEGLYISYVSTDIAVDPPHNMLKMACCWLTAAFAYSKINLGKAPRFKQGPLTVFRDTDAHKQYMRRYYEVLGKIAELADTKEHDT